MSKPLDPYPFQGRYSRYAAPGTPEDFKPREGYESSLTRYLSYQNGSIGYHD